MVPQPGALDAGGGLWAQCIVYIQCISMYSVYL